MFYTRFRHFVFAFTGIGWAIEFFLLTFPARTFDPDSDLFVTLSFSLLVTTPLSVLVSIPPGSRKKWDEREWWKNALLALGLVLLAAIAFGAAAIGLFIISYTLDPHSLS